ncbi:MAG: hypothetical protein GY786_21640 [Proteobacteria bacterium]|nr:hypothetical protein [Pseudomonadota bacterium]
MCQEDLNRQAGDLWVLDLRTYSAKKIPSVLDSMIQSVRSRLIPLAIIVGDSFTDLQKKIPEPIWGNPLIELVSSLIPPALIENSFDKLILFSKQVIVDAEPAVENKYLKQQTNEAEHRMKRLVLENDTLLQEVHQRVKNNLRTPDLAT